LSFRDGFLVASSFSLQDLVGTVYNWQVMQCLYLWARVIAKARRASPPGSADAIAELAYPLIQVVIGILK
jgi:hypothetical protein